MRVNKKKLAGTAGVYRFTLSQMIRAKANVATLVMFLIAALVIPPIMAFFSGEAQVGTCGIETAYVKNESGYSLDLNKISQEDPYFADTDFQEGNMTLETAGGTLEESQALFFLEKDRENFSLKVTACTADKTSVSDKDLDRCIQAVSKVLDQARYEKIQATPEQMAILTGGYAVDSQRVDSYLEEEEADFESRFSMQMFYSVLVLMLCTFTTSYIVQKVIEEKASKLAELLLVSIHPMALLLGKILAVMTYIVLMMGGFFGALWISGGITEKITGVMVLEKMMAGMGVSGEAMEFAPGMILMLVISLLLGYATTSLLAGLLAAGSSSTEDAEPINMMIVFLILVGYLAAIMTIGTRNEAVATTVSLVPIFSIFCAPSRFLLGDIGVGVLLLSWAIQAAVILLLAFGSGRIYRDLMMYRGSRMKLSQMFSMMKKQCKGGTVI